MEDDLENLIKNHAPDILKDQYSRLCYEIFIESEAGKTLLGHLFNHHINRPFGNLREKDPIYDTTQVLVRAAQRDLIQGLLLSAQSYQSALIKK